MRDDDYLCSFNVLGKSETPNLSFSISKNMLVSAPEVCSNRPHAGFGVIIFIHLASLVKNYQALGLKELVVKPTTVTENAQLKSKFFRGIKETKYDGITYIDSNFTN